MSSPYDNLILAEASLVAFFKMNDTASGGQIAFIDSKAGHSTNLVSSAPFTSVAGLVGDSENAISCNSNATNAPGTGTGWPSGAHAWAIELWCNISPFVAFPGQMFGFGAAAAHQTAIIQAYLNGGGPTGYFQADSNGGGQFYGPIAAGVHYVVAMYDGGTTIYIAVDNNAPASATITAMNIPNNPTFNIFNAPTGVANSGGPYTLQKIAVYSDMLSATQRQTHYNAGQGIFPSNRKVFVIGSLPLVGTRAGSDTRGVI